MITALLSSVLIGEQIGTIGWIAIIAIALGLLSLMFVRRDDGVWDSHAAGLALITGCFIAGYSLTDGIGARVAGSALGFYGALSLVNSALMAVVMEAKRPGLTVAVLTQNPGNALLAGGASFVAFSLVVWAFTQAPIALVAALRETSVVFALLIGVTFLKEKLDLRKVFATAMTAMGVLLVKSAR